MLDMNSYESLKTEIDAVYPELLKIQEEWLKKNWRLFNVRKAKLECAVSEKFGEVIKGIELVNGLPDEEERRGEILGYEVEYTLDLKSFVIKITKLKTPRGIMDDEDVLSSSIDCPHLYLEPICGWEEEVHPRIREFKREYSVRAIKYPNNNCEHK